MAQRIYEWEEDIVVDALKHFTKLHCGSYDDDFFTDCAIQAYCDPAWESCVVMDYIDSIVGPMLDKYAVNEC